MNISGVSPIPNNIYSNVGKLNLSQDTRDILKLLGLGTGSRIVNVQKGVDISNLAIQEISQEQTAMIAAEIANELGINEALDSIVAVVGEGADLIRESLDELEGLKRKRVDKSKIEYMARILGIDDTSNVLFVLHSQTESNPGGLVLVQFGLQEIEDRS